MTPSTSCSTTRSPSRSPTTSEIRVLVENPRAHRVVVYTWNFHPDLVASARGQGVHGYLSKSLPARDLVAALEAVHAGEIVVSDPPPPGPERERAELAGSRRGPHRPGVGDPGPDHPGQEQRRGRRAHLPEPEHREVLHPHHLPQDRRRQSHPGGALGREQRLQPGPPPDRPLARWALIRRGLQNVFRADRERVKPCPAAFVQRTLAGIDRAMGASWEDEPIPVARPTGGAPARPRR